MARILCRLSLSVIPAFMFMVFCCCGTGMAESVRIYVGTYTQGDSQGIYTGHLNLDDGSLSEMTLAAEAVNPSFLALHPSRPLLFAVNETADFGGRKSGGVSAFAIDDESGALELLNQQPSRGGAPCHLVVDQTGRFVLVANYTGGSVASLPIQEDGRLGPSASFVQHQGSSVNQRRQSGPHAHSINLDHTNRFAAVADLGIDQVVMYRFRPNSGHLVASDTGASVTPGAGPRHFAFHPGGKFAYVINELDLTVTAFRYDGGRGSLQAVQTVSTLPAGTDPVGSTADLHVHPSGKFLYGSNRGHDSIVVYGIDAQTGELTYVENESTQGKTPRNFALDPSGAFLLAENQGSGSIVVFRIDPETGSLQPTGHSARVPSPVCIQMRARR